MKNTSTLRRGLLAASVSALPWTTFSDGASEGAVSGAAAGTGSATDVPSGLSTGGAADATSVDVTGCTPSASGFPVASAAEDGARRSWSAAHWPGPTAGKC